MKYYELHRELIADGWYLGDLNLSPKKAAKLAIGMEVDVRKYKDLKVEVYEGKVPVDYMETIDGIAVISEALADLLYEYGSDIQLIPVTPEPAPRRKGNYYVLVFKHAEDCVDESRSSFELYDEESAPSPDLIGGYKAFIKLKIDPARVKSALFRLAKYDISVIVNEKVKKSLAGKGFTGFKFSVVS